ncbi:MAG: dihydrolipoyllysine-residue acetyltransferase [Thermoleophilia bacterium]
MTEVRVPDIGDFSDVPVIEVLVSPGDTVEAEDPVVVLESDKASMEVPSPSAGTVAEVSVKVGDEVSQGDLILTLEGGDGGGGEEPEAGEPEAAEEEAEPEPAEDGDEDEEETDGPPEGEDAGAQEPHRSRPPAGTFQGDDVYAGPGARRMARQLGVDLGDVKGSGPKGRITKEDVQAAGDAGGAKPAPAEGAAVPSGLPAWPQVDFEAFGPVERVELSRIARIAGPALARNWAMIPHVTQHDDADITELEAFRKEVNAAHKDEGVKVTMVSLLLKACAAALREFPHFNASLDGGDIIVKRYLHIGFAADTPNGLMVPVIRDVDRKGLLEIARELTELSGAARDGSLKREQMQGGTFTISSLGGIGGTYFTPIINAPEVAILGVSRSAMRPVWNGTGFIPRLILPLSLSYDHRVIDGAAAARFTTHLSDLLSDPRKMLL